MAKKNMVIGFYGHPEYYPPTLNAIDGLSEKYDEICIVHRNYPSFNWEFPSNVKLIANGMEFPIAKLENETILRKIGWFLRFTRILFQQVQRVKPDTILLYDSIAVLAYCMIKPLIKSPRVLWYHNHDVTDLSAIRKYSIGWWAWKAEKWIFNKLDIFTLPALERQVFFPMTQLKGSFYFLPNYPSVKMYNHYKKEPFKTELKILYQGSIAPMHGLEEITEILNKKINGLDAQLILKGFVSPDYLSALNEIAEKNHVQERLIYKTPGGYQSVIDNAAVCHIGIGIHRKEDVMNKTLGTASNKIYEYAASGMPVLLYDNNHFKEHLQKSEWAFFTDCTIGSLSLIFNTIVSNYNYHSNAARQDFEKKFNFEMFFNAVLKGLETCN